MPLAPDEALVAAYLRRYNRLRIATGTTVGRLWDRFGGVDDTAQTAFAERAATTVAAAQAVTATTTDGYLAAALTLQSGELFAPTGLRPAYPRPVDPSDVYRRGSVTARTVLAAGGPLHDALSAGRARMVDTAETDVALTQRATTVEVLSSDERVVGYRRVLTGKSCALCATASTQRYHTGQLMPIHGHCDCGVAPIYGNRDPGHIINRPLVADLKNAGRVGGDPDYWQSRRITVDADGSVHLPDIAVRDHGELGPVLTERSHDFTGPGDIAA